MPKFDELWAKYGGNVNASANKSPVKNSFDELYKLYGKGASLRELPQEPVKEPTAMQKFFSNVGQIFSRPKAEVERPKITAPTTKEQELQQRLESLMEPAPQPKRAVAPMHNNTLPNLQDDIAPGSAYTGTIALPKLQTTTKKPIAASPKAAIKQRPGREVQNMFPDYAVDIAPGSAFQGTPTALPDLSERTPVTGTDILTSPATLAVGIGDSLGAPAIARLFGVDRQEYEDFIVRGFGGELSPGQKAIRGVGKIGGSIGQLVALGNVTTGLAAKAGLTGTIAKVASSVGTGAASGAIGAYGAGANSKQVVTEAAKSAAFHAVGGAASGATREAMANKLLLVAWNNPEYQKLLTAAVSASGGAAYGLAGGAAKAGVELATGEKPSLNDVVATGLTMAAADTILSLVTGQSMFPQDKSLRKSAKELKDMGYVEYEDSGIYMKYDDVVEVGKEGTSSQRMFVDTQPAMADVDGVKIYEHYIKLTEKTLGRKLSPQEITYGQFVFNPATGNMDKIVGGNPNWFNSLIRNEAASAQSYKAPMLLGVPSAMPEPQQAQPIKQNKPTHTITDIFRKNPMEAEVISATNDYVIWKNNLGETELTPRNLITSIAPIGQQAKGQDAAAVGRRLEEIITGKPAATTLEQTTVPAQMPVTAPQMTQEPISPSVGSVMPNIPVQPVTEPPIAQQAYTEQARQDNMPEPVLQTQTATQETKKSDTAGVPASDTEKMIKSPAYHAGDLGKSETLAQQTGGRSTGHFGTGTYFVGDKAKIDLGAYKDRPQHVIDLDGYNLYTPKSESEARKAHDVLKFVNDYWSVLDKADDITNAKNDVSDLENAFDDASPRDSASLDRIEEILRRPVFEHLVTKDMLDDFSNTQKGSDEYARQVTNIINKAKDAIKWDGSIGKFLDKLNNFEKEVEVLGISADEAKKLVRQIGNEITSKYGKNWILNDEARGSDSVSTRLMKMLGYEGVDVRHIAAFDNTDYGTVVYDLKQSGEGTGDIEHAKKTSTDGQKADANALEVSPKRYFRYTGQSGKPMSDWGHAMFADEDGLHKVSGGTYGKNPFFYDGTNGVHIKDLEDAFKQKWSEAQDLGFTRIGDDSITELSPSQAFELFNPTDIVDSAGAWDNGDLLEWFYENVAEPNNIGAVLTDDGAIVFDENLIKPVEQKSIDEWLERKQEVERTKAKEMAVKQKQVTSSTTEPPVATIPPDERNFDNVKPRKVQAIQAENPAVKTHIQSMAQSLMTELNEAIKGERFVIRGEDGAAIETRGVKRDASPSIERILDNLDSSYKNVRDALQRIIDDQGRENTALAKRIELVIDDNLTQGYEDMFGNEIPPNQDYIALTRNEVSAVETDADNDYGDIFFPGEPGFEKMGKSPAATRQQKVEPPRVGPRNQEAPATVPNDEGIKLPEVSAEKNTTRTASPLRFYDTKVPPQVRPYGRWRNPTLSKRGQGKDITNNIDFYVVGDNLYMAMWGPRADVGPAIIDNSPERWFALNGFKNYKAEDVIRGTSFGSHYNDGIRQIWRDYVEPGSEDKVTKLPDVSSLRQPKAQKRREYDASPIAPPKIGDKKEPDRSGVITKQKVFDAINDFATIYPGKLDRRAGRDAAGTYTYRSQHISARPKFLYDTRVLTHELGHHLDSLFINDSRLKQQYTSELLGVPYVKVLLRERPTTSLETAIGEGVAEFFYMYLTDPTQAETTLPGFYDAVQDELANYPDLQDKLYSLQQLVTGYLQQDARAETDAMIVDEVPREGILSNFYAKAVDELDILQKMTDFVTKQKPSLDSSVNPILLARNARRSQSRAQYYLLHGQAMFDGSDTLQRLGPSLKEIIEPVEQLGSGMIREFERFLVARHALEINNRVVNEETGEKMVSGLRSEAAEKLLQDIEKEPYADVFKEQAKKLYEYNQFVLFQLVESGVLSPKDYATIIGTYEHYVPWYRAVEWYNSQSGQGGGKMGNRGAAVKRQKGGDMPIHSPLQSIVLDTIKYTHLAALNKPLKAMYELSGDPDIKGLGAWYREVPADQIPTTVDIGDTIKKALLNQGVSKDNLAGLDLDNMMVTFFKPEMFGDTRENVVSFFVNGERKFLQFDSQELLYAVMHMDRDQLKTIGKIGRWAGSVLRKAHTSGPKFGIGNFFSDTTTTGVFSENNFIPFVDGFKGFWEVLKMGDYYKEWLAAGGAMHTLDTFDSNFVQKTLSLTQERTLTQKMLDAVNIFDHFEKFSTATEYSSKVAEYKKARQQGKDHLTAVEQASDVMIDHNRHGRHSDGFRAMVPFMGSWIQGTDKIYRSFRDNPRRSIMRSIMYVTIPSIMIYMINRNNPNYEELPEWQKAAAWNIPIGDPNSTKWFFPIKKPYTLGFLFGSIPEKFLQYVDKQDKKAFEGIMQEALNETTFSMTFWPIELPMELAANYDRFRGIPIVPDREKDLPPAEQYGPYTPELVKRFGSITNASPRKIDHIQKQLTGEMGRIFNQTFDLVLPPQDGITKPKKDFLDIPLLGQFVTESRVAGSVSIEQFYSERDKLTKLSNKKNPTQADKEKLRELKRMDVVAKQLADLRKKEREVHTSKRMSPEEKSLRLEELQQRQINTVRKYYGLTPIP